MNTRQTIMTAQVIAQHAIRAAKNRYKWGDYLKPACKLSYIAVISLNNKVKGTIIKIWFILFQ